jgi:hypothetical protein
MPCERKHIEWIQGRIADVEIAHHGLGAEVNDAIAALYEAADSALAACDESPCVWHLEDDYWMPGCIDENEGLSYTQRMLRDPLGWKHCPHCGRKIAPLPAAPEEKP